LWDPGRALGKHPTVIGAMVTPVHHGFVHLMNQCLIAKNFLGYFYALVYLLGIKG
jgi:hypothetical protein